jgi:hypothetical protein
MDRVGCRGIGAAQTSHLYGSVRGREKIGGRDTVRNSSAARATGRPGEVYAVKLVKALRSPAATSGRCDDVEESGTPIRGETCFNRADDVTARCGLLLGHSMREAGATCHRNDNVRRARVGIVDRSFVRPHVAHDVRNLLRPLSSVSEAARYRSDPS